MSGRGSWWRVGVAVVSAAVACSANSGEESKPGTGGSAGVSGNGASGGSSGSAGASGSGGTFNVDSGTGGSTGGSGGVAGDACAATTATADPPMPLPADIIWAVDQSGSMDQETSYVQSKINDFASLISGSNIDYRVVMIASTGGSRPICVPPPLSGGGCGDGPRFRLVNVSVDSNDALNKIIAQYPAYSDFLRPNAVKHFVVVTDDDATDGPYDSAAAFSNGLAGLAPAGMFAKWVFHGIFAYGGTPIIGCIGPFGTGAAIGTVYQTLVNQTGGAKGVICVDNWTPVFNAINTSVVQASKVSCEYAVPAPSGGQTLDPTKVNVEYLPMGNAAGAQTVYRVSDASQCSVNGGKGEWYFDDNQNPTKILLCPSTCTAVQSDAMARIDVKFGCESVFKPPE